LDELLIGRLDRLAVEFKTSQPAFFNAYTAARVMVVRPRGRSGKADAASVPAPGDLQSVERGVDSPATLLAEV
jgi:hypothetical protein